MQDTFEMLEELLEQEQFELLFPKENGAQAEWECYETYENNERKQGEKDSLARVGKEKNPGDIRLVYLMNDAVESFLIFRDARLTGSYLENYEGPLKSSLSQEGDEYILVVWQGENVVTLFFRMLDLEVYLYNYGEIGHFWVPGYEYLRQLEYTFAIIRDKREYLGERYCNRREQKLAALADFPPLNYTCYPAISKEYLVERENAWKPAGQALSVMEELLKETGDKQLLRLVRLYAMFPVKILARYIAMQLHRTKHRKVVQLLQQQVQQAAKYYPERKFSGKEEKKFREQRKRAQDCAREWEEKGYRVDIFREEPFTVSRDSVEGKYYVMIWKKGFRNQKVKIEEIL